MTEYRLAAVAGEGHMGNPCRERYREMIIAVTAVAILGVSIFIGLAARRNRMNRAAIWLSALLAAAILTAASFTVMERLVVRLETIYWQALPLGWNLYGVRIFFSGCSWFVVANLTGWAGAQILNRPYRPSGQDPQESMTTGGYRIVGGFAIVLLALIAYVFAKSHAPYASFLDKLVRPSGAFVLPVWAYYGLHSAAALLTMAGLLLACRGYYLLARRPVQCTRNPKFG